MADPNKVANQDGPFRSNDVDVETHYLAKGYELRPFDHTEVEPTGRLKVLSIVPLLEGSAEPRFLGRWDEGAQHLDFDRVDVSGHVQKGLAFSGHHSTPLSGRRFAVELATVERGLIFRGLVTIALGIRKRLVDQLQLSDSLAPKFIPKPGIGP